GGELHPYDIDFAHVVAVPAFDNGRGGVEVGRDATFETARLVNDQTGPVVVVDLYADARDCQPVIAFDAVHAFASNGIRTPWAAQDERLSIHLPEDKALLAGAGATDDLEERPGKAFTGRGEIGIRVGEGGPVIVRIADRRQTDRRLVERRHLANDRVVDTDEKLAGSSRRGRRTECPVKFQPDLRAQIRGAEDESRLSGAHAFSDEQFASQQLIHRTADGVRDGDRWRGNAVVDRRQSPGQRNRGGLNQMVDHTEAHALESGVVHVERYSWNREVQVFVDNFRARE